MGASNPVFDLDRLHAVVDDFLQFDAFAFDVETKGDWPLDPRRNIPFWIVLAGPGCRTEVIPFGHPHGEQIGVGREPREDSKGNVKYFKVPIFADPPAQLSIEDVLSALKRLFWSPIRKVGQNVKFDAETLAKYWGEFPPGPWEDTQVLAHLKNENQHVYKLGNILERELGIRYDKSIGAAVWNYSFSVAADYTHRDGRYTWLLRNHLLPIVQADGLDGVFELAMDVLPALMAMETSGIPLDVERAQALDRELDRQLVIVKRKLFEIVGREWNFDSNPQKQQIFYGPKSQGGRGLKPVKKTGGGAPSCDEEALRAHEGDPLVDTFLEYGDLSKVSSTYVKSYLGTAVRKTRDKNRNNAPALGDDGRVHANFKQTGTVTGRFSCVAGSTMLPTSRGLTRMDEYVPQLGDLVPTHRGRWRPVIRKLYKGLDEMYRVCLANGNVLDCTAEHRLLTPDGWRYVGAIHPGGEVLSYVGIPVLREELAECGGSAGLVFERSEQADTRMDRGRDGHHVPDGPMGGGSQCRSGEVQGREGAAVLTLEEGREEPYVGQEWFAASQLHRRRGRRVWAPAAQGERRVRLGAPNRDGRRVGTRQVARVGSGASLGRGQDEQRVGQPRTRHQSGPCASASRVQVTQIIPLGRMGVWDIEVEGDHSYLAQGFFHHNCSEPNLQNIPRPDTDLGKQVRELFIAPPGCRLVVADYKQIEYVVMAHFSRDPTLIRFFEEGRDFHLAVASMILDKPEDQVTKVERTTAKNTNFAIAYGAGISKIARMSGISEKQARRFAEAHRDMLPALYRFTRDVIRVCRSRRPPHVKTLLGRKRRLPTIFAKDDGLRAYAERQAVNTVVQGSAADINQLALVRLHDTRLANPWFEIMLTVHDEFVISVPEDRVAEAKALTSTAMLGAGVQELLDVPLGADIQDVSRWSDAKS